jgi:hypothetical protein
LRREAGGARAQHRPKIVDLRGQFAIWDAKYRHTIWWAGIKEKSGLIFNFIRLK